jgi:HSP20 family protein
LSELFGDFPDQLRGHSWQPAVDVFETEAAILVRVEIPGVRGEDIRVNIDGEVLRVSGVRKVPADATVKRLHKMEIAFGPFHREVRIGVPFDRERVSAHLEDGFLSVTLPRQTPVRRQVTVEKE